MAERSPAAGSPTSAPSVPSLIDARWMGFAESEAWNWTAIDRRIMTDFQQFGFRPVGETGSPRPCQGCGKNPPTAEVKVYAPGRYDPTAARSGTPVNVDGRGGFYRGFGAGPPAEPDGFTDALLAWPYADDAWVTVRGLTDTTGDLDRMLELALALRPDDRTPVRLPLSLRTVPAGMPLATIHSVLEPINHADGEYETLVDFAPCVSLVKATRCADTVAESGFLRVLVLPRDDYEVRDHGDEVARTIGDRAGRYDERLGWAAVLVRQGMLVQFDLSAPRGAAPGPLFAPVLDGVEWAADPAVESTWRPVADWVKQ